MRTIGISFETLQTEFWVAALRAFETELAGRNIQMLQAVADGLALAVHLLLSRTMYGHWLYAVGHNVRMARVSGVPVSAVTAGAYALSGLLSAAAVVLYTGQSETASPFLGQRLLLDVIAATVIGGTSLFGGRGKVLWTLAGVLFINCWTTA